MSRKVWLIELIALFIIINSSIAGEDASKNLKLDTSVQVGGTGYNLQIGENLLRGNAEGSVINNLGKTQTSRSFGDLGKLNEDSGMISPGSEGQIVTDLDRHPGATYHKILDYEGHKENAYKVAVIGDSIAWGNGLSRDETYFTQVATSLRDTLKMPVEVTVYAHSGAKISNEVSLEAIGSRVSGIIPDANLNKGYPTLMDQAAKVSSDTDLILVSGGINDVGIMNVLNVNKPANGETGVYSLSEKSIKRPMTELLTYLLDKTEADTKIVVTGYYPIISSDSTIESQDQVVTIAAQSHEMARTGLANGLNINENNINEESRLAENSRAFYGASKDSLISAVDDANKEDNDRNRVVFADPSFEVKNSYGASDSFLGELNPDYTSNDDQYPYRSAVVARNSEGNPIEDYENQINAIGHPNTKGASQYADVIKTTLGLPIAKTETQEPSFGSKEASFGESSSTDIDQSQFESSSESDLGGINFTSIKLNYISASTDQEGRINFDLLLKAEKAEGTRLGTSIINSTAISAAAFLTGLAVPDNKFLVCLDPKDPDRIIDEELAQSDVGRIMLEADLQMKKDIHYYDNPCANKTGKAQWDLLDTKREALVQKCMDKYPGEIENIYNVWFMPVTRFWIIPDKVYAYTNGTQIYIINATLTIESEPETDDSFVQINNQDIRTLSKGCLEELNKSAKEYGEYYKELNNRMILPYVIADVNHGEKYEDLRNVYVALALAQWYKSRVTPHMDIFRDSLESSRSIVLSALRPWNPKGIWDRYIYSYKNGEYKCWENTTTKTARGSHTEYRSRQAGGVSFGGIKDHMVEIETIPSEVHDQINSAIANGYVDEGIDVVFGNRLHVSSEEYNVITGSISRSALKPAKQNGEDESGSSESRTDKGISLPNEMTSGQNNTTSPKLAASGSASKVTCPEGWMGPDEKGECWQMQIMS